MKEIVNQKKSDKHEIQNANENINVNKQKSVGRNNNKSGNGMLKTTFREIRSSFGRFFAIFAIIALGVGFFAGLKVTKGAMMDTVENYLDNHGFFDLQLLSTLGFEQEDVDLFRAKEDVEAAEGGLSFDVIYRTEDGNQGVVRAYSLTEGVNTVKLVAGRMPSGPDECLADSAKFGEAALGSTLYISEDNEDEDRGRFVHSAYKIVGLVQSPLYLQYERGNTSLGNGRIDGFVYLMREGFDADFYTEVYVRFQQDHSLYSDEYDELIKEKTGIWEKLVRSTADRRYQDILADAQEELAQARQELDEKRAEGEGELADAAGELADARDKIARGERELADAGKEIADNEALLKDNEAELADAEAQIADNEAELADAEALLDAKETELAGGEAQLAEAEGKWREGSAELENARREADEGRKQLDAGRQQIAGERNSLQSMAAAGAITAEQLQEGLSVLEARDKELDAAQARLDEADETISRSTVELSESWKEIERTAAELKEGRAALASAQQELLEGRAALADAKAELAEGRKALEEGRQKLNDAKADLLRGEEELVSARQELADGEKKYEDAQREFREKTGDAEAELADAQERLEELENPDVYVLGRNTNIGYVCFESDSNIVEGISNIFPIFFFLVAALVCITTMNRMVEEQRTQIGVLKALGYGEAAIMSKFMIYSGLAALAGCVFGFLLGTWGFPKVIWFAYGIMYHADPIVYVFNWWLAAVSLAVSLLCSIGTTWLSCRAELKEAAATLMRPKAPKAGKRIFLEYIPFLWNRLGFLRKVSLRNIFRYKKRLFMMVVGISGCTALLVTGFGIEDSIGDVADRQFKEIQIYDIGVSLKEGADQRFMARLEEIAPRYGIEAYAPVMEKTFDLVAAGGIKSVYLVAGTEESMPDFLNMHTVDGRDIPYPQAGEAVISNKLADTYRIRPGDTVTLRDDEMKTLTLTVSAVYENYISNYVHISEETWRQLWGSEPERNTVYVNIAEDADAHGLSAALMGFSQVASVTVNADTMERVGNMMASLDLIVVVVVLCAAGLAFIVLYNLTNINITERIREIATIKVLGFYKKETASYVFRENILLTVLGALLGALLGVFLHRFVMSQIQVDLMSFDVYIKPVSYGYSILLTLVFTLLVNWGMSGKLEKISMTESLKSVD